MMPRTLGFLLFLLLAASANAASWYVAPGGADWAAGTIDRPLATITKAAAFTHPGDVVYVRAGVYHEVVKISSRGTSTAAIIFRSYPGELAVIDGTGTPLRTDLVQLNGTDWVDFAGFEVRNSTQAGIRAEGARNTRILDNTVHDCVRAGIWMGYSSFGVTTNLTISGNRVFHNVLENQFHSMSRGWAQAIGVQRVDGVRIASNRIYENDGEGIGVILTDNATVVKNEISDNYSVELYLDNAQFTTADSNFIYSSGQTRYYRNGYPAHGIGMANESYSDSNPLTDDTITNNIILRSRWAIFYGNYENGGGLKNTRIANNTIYDATHALLSIDAAAHLNSWVENNIFDQAGGIALAVVAGTGVTYRNNNWYGGSAGAASGPGDVIANPQLVNAGGATPQDYKLTAASPDVLAAVSVSYVTNDFFGQPRAAQFDIGAHELSGTVLSKPPARRRSVGRT